MKDENKDLFIGIKELRNCSDDQLKDVIFEAKRDMHEIIHQSMHGNKVMDKKPHRRGALKKQIARCETILMERMRL